MSTPGATSLLKPILRLTVLFELFTCVLRFGLQLESTRDTASTIGHLTCGFRIHHSYIGALLILWSGAIWIRRPRPAGRLMVIGSALFFSDVIHHFLVLWLLTGSPQFDLVYP